MMRFLYPLHRRLGGLRPGAIFACALGATLAIGGIDLVTGYELSMSLFYLGPVALAAWYANRRTGMAVAAISCLTWYCADAATGHAYTHPAIPVWNALVRLGFFCITSFLLDALRASLREQQQLARTDALTGLYGRRAADGRLRHDLALGQRRKSPLTIAYVDLDDFKTVNDTYGHAGGDSVLRLVGHTLSATVRETDTPVRMGGDEFAIIMPDTDADEARGLMARITRGLRAAFAGSAFQVTWSIGIVTFPGSAVSAGDAFTAADELMYRVKRSGKGAVAFDVARPAAAFGAADAESAARH